MFSPCDFPQSFVAVLEDSPASSLSRLSSLVLFCSFYVRLHECLSVLDVFLNFPDFASLDAKRASDGKVGLEVIRDGHKNQINSSKTSFKLIIIF